MTGAKILRVVLNIVLAVWLVMTPLQSSSAEEGDVAPQYHFQGLGLVGGAQWRPTAISDVLNGSVTVVGNRGSNAVRWNQVDGAQLLSAPTTFTASDVSGDGKTIVGTRSSPLQAFRQAAVWNQTSGLVVDLGSLPGGINTSDGYAITRDGRFAVGTSASDQGFAMPPPGKPDVSGQGFYVDLNSATPVVAPLEIQNPRNFTPSTVGYRTEDPRDAASDGEDLWTIGTDIPRSSGSPRVGVLWKNGESFNDLPIAGSDPGSVVPEAITVVEGTPRIVVNSPNRSPLLVIANTTTNALEPLAPLVGVGTSGFDISTDGSVVVGERFLNTSGSIPVIWRESKNWIGSNLETELSENLFETTQDAIGFDDWDLNAAVGVTSQTTYLPSLGTDLVTTVLVGGAKDPSGAEQPWLTTIREVLDLDPDGLVRTTIPGGVFESGVIDEWTVEGIGSVVDVTSPFGTGQAAELTTDTEVSISRLIDTPAEAFILSFDQAYQSDLGSVLVTLDGVVVGENFATDLSGSTSVSLLVADPNLLGRSDIKLRFSAFGGSIGQVTFDNISIAMTPEPAAPVFLLLLMSSFGRLRRRRSMY